MKNGENHLPLVLQRTHRAGKGLFVQPKASVLCTMRKNYALAVRGRSKRARLLRFLAIEIRLTAHRASELSLIFDVDKAAIR